MSIVDKYEQGIITAWRAPTPADNAEFRAACRAAPTFSQAAPDLMADTEIKTICFWDITEKVLKDNGIDWITQYQKSGTCVGQSDICALDDLQCLHVYKNGLKFEGRAAVAGAYTFGRVEVAGRAGRWDGSNCTWSGRGNVEYGILLKKHLGLPENSLDEDEELAVKWTASRDGVPEKYEKMANDFRVAQATKCKNTKELAVALNNLCTAMQGSMTWATGECNELGVSPLRRRSGGHAQGIRGVIVEDGKLFFAEQNSWGKNWAPGYKGKYRVPPGCVLLSEADMQKQIDEDDCIILSGPQGFVRQSIDFRI